MIAHVTAAWLVLQAGAGSAPALSWEPCAFAPGETSFLGQTVDPARLRCGSLRVPARRGETDVDADTAGPTIRLAFVVIAAAEPAAGESPLVYLIGGPGNPALIPYVLGLEGPSLATGRDVVVFDQRATGRSEPRVCPRRGPGTAAIARADLTRDETIAAAIADLRNCVAEMGREGLRARDLDIDANVADIEDLRQALGYTRWHVMGISFGGALAQRLMLSHPATVESAILVNPAPSDWSNFDRAVPLAAAVLDSVYSGCARAGECAEAFPLGQIALLRAHGALADRPWTIRVDPAALGPGTFTLNATDLMAIVSELSYNDLDLRFFPAIVDAFVRRDSAVARAVVERVWGGPNEAIGDAPGSDAPSYSVWCRDAVDAGSRARWEAAAEGHPEALRDIWFDYLDQCEAWGVDPIAPEKRRAPAGEAPVLVVSGGLDSIVSASSGEDLLRGLPNGRQVIFRHSAHILPSSFETAACLYALANAFLEDPSAPLADDCVADLPALTYTGALPDWVDPAAEPGQP
jgi:pimeloyl-ACP methyl ester carboxylesterase